MAGDPLSNPANAVQVQNVSDPSSVSNDYAYMKSGWDMIQNILSGIERIRLNGIKYLPKYEGEGDGEYKRRLHTSPWRPEFEDTLRNLAAKPFQRDVAILGEPSQGIKDFCENVDGRGNNLTAFAREAFNGGVAFGVHGILVDYPVMQPGLTLAVEKASGAHPYFVQLNAENLIAVYTECINGVDQITHLRYRESYSERVGFSETIIQRVRVFEPGRWEVWENRPQVGAAAPSAPASGNTQPQSSMMKVDEGTTSINVVPVVLYFTGKRYNEYFVKPPLLDIAHMQIELYQAMSRQAEVMTFASSPMLKAVGMRPPEPTSDREGNEVPAAKVEVGPKRILWAPPADNIQTDWDYIQPAAANITAISEHVKSIIMDIRRLGMQPETDKKGDVTATASSIDAAKAHSTLQSWALGLKDVLEQAFVFYNMWINSSEQVEVSVHTDFAGDASGIDEAKVLVSARQSGDLSRETLWTELQRRDILSADFDPAEESDLIAEEAPALGTMGIDPVTGQPIQQQDKPQLDQYGKPIPNNNQAAPKAA